MADDTPSPLNNVITIDDERIKNHLDRVAGGSVDQMIGNAKNGSSMRRPITSSGSIRQGRSARSHHKSNASYGGAPPSNL
jgi:hypothetical protein